MPRTARIGLKAGDNELTVNGLELTIRCDAKATIVVRKAKGKQIRWKRACKAKQAKA